MSITELLNNLPSYIVMPLLLLISIALALFPAGILHYTERHCKERTVVVVAIIVSTIISAAITLGYLTME